jgi:restriction endonuclease Mrr
MTVKKEGTQFLRWFGPLLDALRALGGSGTPEEATDKVAELCNVPESKQNELMESGQPRFRNQVAWARFYLKREGLLDSSTRGVWRLTEKGQATQLTYAHGHGILELNAFVTFKVLFQCKRYKGSVGTSQIRDFRGAMEGRADKGIILTTGTFTQEARREARRDGARPIELVDGDKLIDMFEKLELGLKPRTVFEVDDAFFAEFGK